MTPVAFWEHGAPFARGQGAYGVTFALYYTTGIGVGGNEVQVDALTQCFLEHGGTIITNCTVDRIVIEGGRATGVVLGERSPQPGAEIDARVGVLSNAGVPETLRLVGEHDDLGRRRPPRRQDAPLEDGAARLARHVVAARPAHRLGIVRASTR